jgi:hypothetical protein
MPRTGEYREAFGCARSNALRLYTAHLKPKVEPELVREGFAWGAFVFGPLWLAAHRAWIPSALSLAAYVLIVVLAPAPWAFVLCVAVAVLLGLTGADLLGWALEQRGYLLVHVVAARGRDDALLRLLTQRPDLATRYAPDEV